MFDETEYDPNSKDMTDDPSFIKSKDHVFEKYNDTFKNLAFNNQENSNYY